MNFLNETVVAKVMKSTEVTSNVFEKGLVIEWIMKGLVWWDIGTFGIEPCRRVLAGRVPIGPSPLIRVVNSPIIN